MGSLHGFNSWDEISDYITNTLGISYRERPTSWVEAMKAEMKGYRFVKIINDSTGEITEQIVTESVYNSVYAGVGEVHTTSSSQSASSIGGGGVKSAPTAKSVITENTGGGTAVITDEAIGVKDTGVVSWNSPINILSGLIQVYGLIHTGIEIANAQVWKDMSNYVYGTDFDQDTPLERVIDFMGKKITCCVTDFWHAAIGDETLRINIPESIAQRMYEFMSNHMIQQQTPGITPVLPFPYYYNFYKRSIELADPTTRTIDAFKSIYNDPSTPVAVGTVDISDDLFKYCVSDFLQQVIANGFTIANSVATALLASMEGVYAFLKEQSVDDVENADTCEFDIRFYRGSTPPPKETPLALSEFQIEISCAQDTRLNKSGDNYQVALNYKPNISMGAPELASGYSYQNGDLAQYLKAGKTGEDDSDYAYFGYLQRRSTEAGDVMKTWECHITYPSNEQQKTYQAYSSSSTENRRCINGYSGGLYWGVYNATYKDPNYMSRGYSNLCLTGVAISYQPDDYLVTAGIRTAYKADGTTPQTHPDPNKTKEEVYPQLDNTTQNARPQAVKDPDTGVITVENTITNYVPTAVPSGSTNSDILINHGVNNPDDPDSYQDNRPQNRKAEGRVNENDPVDGFNEDVDEAVKKFDDTKYDPNHYPNPIPANEPNPQYPTNPPADTDGDSGDTPTPSTMVGVTASGMCSVYNPTKQELINFSAWLWSPNFLDNFLKIFQNPMDAIIGLHIMYATPATTTPSNIICGYLDSGVAAKVVNQQFTEIDCGTVDVPEYYGNAIDYEPYVQVHCYLPFIGIVSLKPNDVIGKKLNIKYGVDAMTGTCLAILTTKKGTSEIACYNFAGNCATQIPISGGSYAQMITGLAGFVASGIGAVATANPLMALGAGASLLNSHLDVGHSGAIGANAGAMGIRKPYLIITRKSAYEAAGYGAFYGYPANKTVTLGSCKGYTRIKSVHVEIPRATANEKSEIEQLLKQGVIIN